MHRSTRRWAPPRGRTSPSSSRTSTSTVGLPRESRISRAPTASMAGTMRSRWSVRAVRAPSVSARPERFPRPAARRRTRARPYAARPPDRCPHPVRGPPVRTAPGRGVQRPARPRRRLAATRSAARPSARAADELARRATRRGLAERHTVGDRRALLLGLLDLVPVPLDRRRVVGGRPTRRRAGDAGRACRRGRRRRRRSSSRSASALLRDPGVEQHLQQDVAELLA